MPVRYPPNNGGIDPMHAVTSSIIIQRPIEEVFAFVTDAWNNILWQAKSGLKETRQAPESPVGVGTRITEVWNFMGRTEENVSEVTEYAPYSRYVRSQVSADGPIKRGVITFESVAEGTRWTSVVEVETTGLFDIAEPLLA